MTDDCYCYINAYSLKGMCECEKDCTCECEDCDCDKKLIDMWAADMPLDKVDDPEQKRNFVC